MRTLRIGDVEITSIIERDGPWRKPESMFPAYDAAVAAEQDLLDNLLQVVAVVVEALELIIK